MSQIRLLIADKDTMFLEKFSAYLHKNKNTQFSLELFTVPERFIDWVNKGEQADIMLVSSSFLSNLACELEKDNLVILRDSPESFIPQGYRSINKYQPADNLMKELISLYADKLPGERPKSEGSGTVHLVLYGDGSDVFNPMAQAMAVYKASTNKSVFYINLDEFSNTDDFFQGPNTKDLSEMLYYIKAQKENLSLKAEACTSRDINWGVDFMKGHKNPEDISKLNASELKSLIGSIRGRNCYDDIVISRAFRQDELLNVLLDEASRIYITFSDYYSSITRMIKVSQFIKQKEHEKSGLTDKTIFCVTVTGINQAPNASIDIPNFRKYMLPRPYDEEAVYTPRADYISALKTILEQ